MSYITLATATGLFLLVLNPKFVNIIDNNMQICHRERCFWFCKRTTEFSLCLVYLFFSFSISLARCKKNFTDNARRKNSNESEKKKNNDHTKIVFNSRGEHLRLFYASL